MAVACERRERRRNERGRVVLHALSPPTHVRRVEESTGPLRDKAERHAVFADFLVQALGAEALRCGTGVVDVAGGGGAIAAALAKYVPSRAPCLPLAMCVCMCVHVGCQSPPTRRRCSVLVCCHSAPLR